MREIERKVKKKAADGVGTRRDITFSSVFLALLIAKVLKLW